ncbi:chemotaxis protein CheW [Piscinibacter sakaiensis]|uniref:CheW-like domain-containing protein n=1 Tax=Piscinibacter sakaiensis TaxID=1547922 RepID=A0A0K8P3P6_PISS1|nr:chemotaxis protein CheW [Piscinibacter sakaiensis]GAP37179.1 hypothetical protein ISF6_3034 [Piscinibacter sakaiensis]
MDDADELVPHMRRVQDAQRDLRDLGVVWQMIESSAAIGCPEEAESILPTLVRTRERFDALQGRLVQQMAGESRAALGDQLSAKAQCAIDILVRNLFERTADVGFLSTDDEVRRFCGATPEARAAGQAAMRQRLREYQAKYSVYDDVVLLDPQGRVLARLDESRALAASADPLVGEALAAPGWVERFRRTDLSADGGPALLYAQAVHDGHGLKLGVLVLRFRFVDEMHYVFASMVDRHEMALVLIDAEGCVIVGNDDAHVPVGARLAPLPPNRVCLTSFAGREYLAVNCASAGYQGYRGPRWRAQAMVSLLTAFRQRGEAAAEGGSDVPLDNPALHAINENADEINRDLRRVVWNGQLMAGTLAGESRRLRAVLDQVNRSGRRTRDRVAVAIRDLHRTSLGRARLQVADLARLAADIMDRNLYERANDCRWWALSPAIRRLLQDGAGSAPARALGAVLDEVNGLYTVYGRLVVFDAEGRIRGASRDPEQALAGQPVDGRWVEAARTLRDSQRYHVSPFEATPLHDGGPTYTYVAAIHAEDAARSFLGGIAIVFDAARELHAMLRDVLGERQGLAAFVDADGRVLAATDPARAEGLAAAMGGAERALLEHAGVHYAAARVAAAGYREFRTSDGYDHGVRALVALRLGAAERRTTAYSDLALQGAGARRAGAPMQVAVFQVGPMRCALPTDDVVEAVSMQGMVRVPPSMAPTIGLLEVADAAGRPRMLPVVCAREQFGLAYPPRASDGVVLVVRRPDLRQPLVGLRVDDVLAVLEVDRARLQPAPAGFGHFAPWLSGVIEVQASGAAGEEPVLVQWLDIRRFQLGDAVPAVPATGPQALPLGAPGTPAAIAEPA